MDHLRKFRRALPLMVICCIATLVYGCSSLSRECSHEIYVGDESSTAYTALRIVDASGTSLTLDRAGDGIVIDTVRGFMQAGDLLLLGELILGEAVPRDFDVRIAHNGDTMMLRIPYFDPERIYLGDVPFRPGAYYLAYPGSRSWADTVTYHRINEGDMEEAWWFDPDFIDSLRRADPQLRSFQEDQEIPYALAMGEFDRWNDPAPVNLADHFDGRHDRSGLCYRVVTGRSPRRDTILSADEYASLILAQPFHAIPLRAVVPLVWKIIGPYR